MTLENILKRIVLCDGDVIELIQHAQHIIYSGANQTTSVVLLLSDVAHALQLHIDGLLQDLAIVEWGEFLECNEFIEYEIGKEGNIADVLFKLSSPEINLGISKAVSKELLKEIT